MKNTKSFSFVTLVLLIIYITFCVSVFKLGEASMVHENKISVIEQKPVEPVEMLNHEQRAWLGALEWCESKGKPGAINPEDRDNTPSYGILQFKPETFSYFGKLYGVDGDSMDPLAQENIVAHMIMHSDQIAWDTQFPDCVARLGNPPL